MKVAYTGWTWLVNHKDNYLWEFEQFLKEVSHLGYEAVENFGFIQDYFEDDSDKVNALLKKYNLELVNLYLHYSDDPEADYAKAIKFIDFMKRTGATYLNLQGVMWRDEPHLRPIDNAGVLAYATLSNRIGALCKEQGMVACFHPHANTGIFSEEEIDLFLANTDPALVSLCLDTAHTVLAGMNPVDACEKYKARIAYMHLKDVDPDVNYNPKWQMDRFRILGHGTVDFRGVCNTLKKNGYQGVLCVELDNPPVGNFHAAMHSREYIHNVLGL